VIGLTGMPEARLAREAELPYALIGMVTDYDSWRDEEAGVEAFDILSVLKGNADRARAMLDELVATLPDTRAPSPVDTALEHAIITAPEMRDKTLMAKLDAIAGRVLGE